MEKKDTKNLFHRRGSFRVAYNVKRLCAGGDLVVRLLNLVQKPIIITGVQFTTDAPLAQNRC